MSSPPLPEQRALPEAAAAPKRSRPRPRRAALRSVTALQPLGVPVFRLLWSTWLAANLCMWMSDVAAAWTMTTLTTTPIWVALVQSASTLPVFLLGLPSGALADILDRRRWLMFTQFWLAGTALALCAATALGLMTRRCCSASSSSTASAWRCAGRCSRRSCPTSCRAASSRRRWRSTAWR
jgi:hypothetical protein